MDINKVLMQYDNMFDVDSMEDIEDFLAHKIDEAYKEEDYYSAITLLNEMIGLCRDTSQGEKADKYSNQVLELMASQEINGTVEYATTLLNIANAYRAFGKLEKSLKLYEDVENIYNDKLETGAFNYASLYNNWSLLYQELGDFVSAANMLGKALKIVDQYPKAVMEQATTRTNIAVTLLRLSREEKDEASSDKVYNTAMKYLEQALLIYENDGGRDFHYSAALSAMGDVLYYKNKFTEAAEYYGRALEETERHVGKTDAYYRIQDNYEKAIQSNELANYDHIMNDFDDAEKMIREDGKSSYKNLNNKREFKNNMERCMTFYYEHGAAMIKEKFPEYESRIAVGLVGDGSDCMEYDDDISKDHDYGVGFCLWLTDEIYGEIGEKLQQEYDKLVENYSSEFFRREENDKKLSERRGVFTIGRFYDTVLDSSGFYDKLCGLAGYGQYSLSEQMWLRLSEERISLATNGRVFRDDLGEFSRVRTALKEYYPNKVIMLKLAQYIHDFSQAGQYNYVRMMARHDYTTANICKAKAIDNAMHIIYILNAKFAPYYKWLRRGLDDVNILAKAVKLLDEISELPVQKEAWEHSSYSPYMINVADKTATAFEDIAGMILDELNKRRIVRKKDTFLDSYASEIASLAYVNEDKDKSDVYENKIRPRVSDVKEGRVSKVAEELIEEIVLREWNQFDKVDNEGGRADCQDDWNTFSIMRRSQYMTWNEDLLTSYRNDLAEADSNGWNLITEKYARMMESTSPEEFEELKEKLPYRSPERIAIQEEIIKIQIEWMEEFAAKYPKMAGNSRSIHTYEDSHYNTSYETYLRGEISTYSDDTLVLYGRFIAKLNQDGKNLAFMIMSNTAKLYGYASVDEAEEKLD
ncbi:MAG: DUF4125 family protein [Lachnospiraceae bacterium]|nr:DUF4125 family protein [Lachnospiraceae bacterium]